MTSTAPIAPIGAELRSVVELPPGRSVWRTFRQDRLALFGLVLLGVIVTLSILGPIVSPYNTTTTSIGIRFGVPSLAHPMGTDELGRDIMTRVLAGGRLSLAVGLIATVMALAIGVLVGAIAGFYGGIVDNVLMRAVDVALSLPDLFLLILAASLLGPSVPTMIVIIALVRWMNVARLVRASFLSLREREFVEAARMVGAGPRRLILVHLLPNSLSPVIVAGTLGVASAIIAESTLSFLGLGIQPPASSWGAMLRNAQSQIFTQPWMAVFPGLMIFLTVISINFVGDGLRAALDPGTRHVSRSSRRRLDELLVLTGKARQAPSGVPLSPVVQSTRRGGPGK
jgi:peptide/nickel transport system permease protein